MNPFFFAVKELLRQFFFSSFHLSEGFKTLSFRNIILVVTDDN